MTSEKRFALDTNVILNNNIYEIVEKYNVAIPSMVIRELENFETNPDKYGQLAYNAREKRRRLKQMDKVYFDLKDYEWRQDDGLSKTYADNNILQYCLDTNSGLISYDGLLVEKAIQYGVEVINVEDELLSSGDDYKGFKEVYMLPHELQEFYQNELGSNKYDLIVNQYLIIRDDVTGDLIDSFKFNGQYHVAVNQKGFKTRALDSFKPKDFFQQCVLDSLESNQVTMIKGAAGSGKSLIALNYAMQQIERHKVDKLICFVNPIGTLNSAKIGYLPGTKDEKILESQIGTMLASKLGDKFQVESMIANNQLELLPFSNLRGIDTTGTNCIVWVIESQNLDISLAKLALERIGETTKVILDGDYNAQVDDRAYEGGNNGMKRVSEVFRGEDYYGEVELQSVYRSKVANKAQEM